MVNGSNQSVQLGCTCWAKGQLQSFLPWCQELTRAKNFSMIIAMRIKMQGFIVFDYASQFPAARKEVAQWLAEGKLQRKETIIKGGLPVAEQALLDLYKGVNTGTFLQNCLFFLSHARTALELLLKVWLDWANTLGRKIVGGGKSR
jgi:hypothetical protein